MTSFLQKYIRGSGGRWGNQATRKQNHAIATGLEAQGWEITVGAGRGSEEYISKHLSNTASATYVDITAQKNGVTMKIQTVDTVRSTGLLTQRELDAVSRIKSAYPNDKVLVIHKEQ